MDNRKDNKMGVMPVRRLVWNMSLPIMMSMLVQALYNIVDSIYVSRVSEQALTAVSLSFPAQNLMIGIATGTAVGVNALLSRALGAKEYDRANRVAEHGVFLAICSFLVLFVFGLFGSRAFIHSQSKVPEIVQYGQDYLTVVCCCSFGLYAQVIFERLMQATGRTFYTMFTQGIGAIINIILDPIFIFTLGMEVRGAAVATVIGQIVAALIAIVLNHRKNTDIHLSAKGFRPEAKLIGQIYAIGIPSVIMMAIGSLMTFLFNKILIAYTKGKETAAAVFGVYFKLNSFAFMPVFGLNNGVIPIVAFNYGARNRLRMLAAIKTALRIALTILAVAVIIFEAFPQLLLGLFDASEQMLAIGMPALRIIASTFIVAAVCIVLGSSFQALGFGTYSLVVSIARQLVVLIPAAWLLAREGMAVGNDNLVWLSFPIAEVASLLASLILFMRMKRDVIDPIPDGAPID